MLILDYKTIEKIKPFVICLLLLAVFLGSASPALAQGQQGNAFSQSVISSSDKSGGQSVVGTVMLWGINSVITAVLYFEARILGMVATVFDMSIMENVRPMSRITAIATGWGITRDVANIFFIIILLFIAIATIFGISSYSAKALLPKLIIIALLINFSLTIGYVVIDFTNVLGIQFYEAMGGADVSSHLMQNTAVASLFNVTGSTSGTGVGTYVLSGAFGGAAIGTIVPVVGTTIGAIVGAIGGALSWLSFGIGLSFSDAVTYFYTVFASLVFISPLIFVFLFGSILLLIRLAVLSILLILAPLAFLFYIIPTQQKLWNEWWHSLFNHAFFFPAFMFMLYISVLVLQQIFSNIPTTSNPQGNIPFLLNLVIGIIFLIGSLIVAKKMGVYGASAVIGWAQKSRRYVTGFVGGAAAGAAAAAYRNTAARAARRTEQSGIVQRNAGRSRVVENISRQLQGIAAFKPGGRQSLIEKQKEIASLKGLTDQQKAEKLNRLTIPQRQLALQDMNAQEFAQMRHMNRNNAEQLRSIDETFGNLQEQDPEKYQKIGDAIGKSVVRRTPEEMRRDFEQSNDNIKEAILSASNREQLQRAANTARTDTERINMLRDVHRIDEAKTRDVLSVMPHLAQEVGENIEDAINRTDVRNISEDVINQHPNIMQEMALRASPEQIRGMTERGGDIEQRYLENLQREFHDVNRNIDQLADRIQQAGGRSANAIRGNQRLQEQLGLRN